MSKSKPATNLLEEEEEDTDDVGGACQLTRT